MSDFARIPVTMVELTIDKCGNTYGVAPCAAAGAAGSECYNTFRTCQDRGNYTLSTQTLSFCTAGAPMPASVQSRPYIRAVKSAPTEIDPEKGLATRGAVTITLTDEPCPDHGQDPYASTRTAAAGGTFWSRFMARNHNYQGRPALVRTGYFTDGWVDGDFVDESYIIDQIKGPTSNGEVTLVLKDTLKLADNVVLPPPNKGKLAAAFGPSDGSFTVETGQGADYDATGFVRIGDQIIQYTAIVGDEFSWPDSTYRSQFGTTAYDQNAGDGVQQCIVYEGVRVYLVIRDLLNRAGIADANIDITGMQDEDDQWLGTRYVVTACLSSPEKASTYLAELAQQTGGVLWWSPTEQKVKYKFIGPQSPAALAGQTITDEANIIDGSTKVEPLDQSRLTRGGIYYNLAAATLNATEGKNYLRGEVYVDADAESANEYGDVRSSVTYSRWFDSTNERALRGWIARRIGQYRDVPRVLSCRLDGKDFDIHVGDLYDVTSAQLTDTAGNATAVRCLVTKRTDNGNGIDLTLRTTNFSRRYGFIAPNGTSDYPANDGYACICLDSGKFSDGTDGYRII